MRWVLSSVLVLVLAAGCGGGSSSNPDVSGAGDSGVADASGPSVTDVSAVDLGSDVPAAPQAELVLNELRCRGGDFVEIHNHSGFDGSLSGWVVSDAPEDEDHRVGFAADAVIPAGGYVVLERGDVDTLPFGLSRSDTVGLYAPDGTLADEVALPELPDGATWARLPDGGGGWDRGLPTPGARNVAYEDPTAALFGDDVSTIEITLPEESRDALNEEPYVYVEAGLRIELPDGGEETAAVGVRLKGRWGSFRPLGGNSAFKVKLNWADGGDRVLGLKKLTLNNMVQDPSRTHELLAYTLFRGMDVPAPRVGYAWVRLDGVDLGLYANIETIDDVMLRRWYAETTHLYEGAYGVDLEEDMAGEFEVDEGDPDDRSDLEALIAAAHAPGDDWFAAVGALADLDEMRRMWAVEVLIDHWDGYAPTRNNYFFHVDGEGRFSMMPWGTDQTFVGEWGWAEGAGLLFARCRETPDCWVGYVAALRDAALKMGELDLVGLMDDTALRNAPFIARENNPEHEPEVVGEYLAATREFLEVRPQRALAWAECWQAGNPDRDEDGWGCLDDCDEERPDINPGAVDDCDNGVDEDCSGTVDDGIGCLGGCERVQIPGHGYTVCESPRTFEDAQAHCAALGGTVWVPDTAGEQRGILYRHEILYWGEYWIGLTDAREEGTFERPDGAPAGWFHWMPGEPNDLYQAEDCAHAFGGFGWFDVSCDAEFPVVCEDACPDGGDADGDGHSACGDDCNDLDPDTYLGAPETCGDNRDRDCSGWADDVDGCPSACQPIHSWGVEAIWCPLELDWASARAFCHGLGRELAWFADESEFDAVVTTLWTFGARNGSWCGLSDAESEGRFVWHDGTEPEFSAWAEGQPNDGQGEGQDCVRLMDGGLWNDTPCEWPLPFICR